MIPILEYFQKMTHSYGWAIVLLTLLIRVLVWPLVVKSTRSMQKMSQLSPHMKAIQAKYKDDPEMFQRKTMEFYTKNRVNPMGGCLPTLVQLPILFALFATFTGPPFGDKPVDVKVNVVKQQDAAQVKRQETSNNNSPYVSTQGELAKVIVFPGESTVVEGQSIDFGTRAVDGKLPQDFSVTWKIANLKPEEKDNPPATIDEQGHATFSKAGEYHVQAVVKGIAKDEQFGPIMGLGKVASGLDLLKPANFDCLALIILFGVTMYLSSKLSMPSTPKVPESELDEQQIIQQQTAKTMPIAVTAMFFFIPLPTGVYLYMVVSNVFQTLQTWIIMRTPVPDVISVVDTDEPPASGGGSTGGSKGKPGSGGSSGPSSSGSGKGGKQSEAKKSQGAAAERGKEKPPEKQIAAVAKDAEPGEKLKVSAEKQKVKKKKK